MSNPLTPIPGSPMLPTTSTGPQHLLKEFPTYAGAERLVDTLSDKGFPVEHTRIVGNGLRTVEYVTGRLTSARAAQAGAASGASFGLLVGLLLGLFSQDSSWLGTVIGCTLIGAAWWAVFGYFAHRATQGRRDFSSIKGLEAERYAVYVDAERADEAIRLAGLF